MRTEITTKLKSKIKSKIKKHPKRSALLVTILVCTLLFSMGITYAWLTDSDRKRGEMHLANLTGEVSKTASTTLIQGTPLTQTITVTNTGGSTAFVRALLLPECSINGIATEIEIGTQLSVTTDPSWLYCPEDGYYYYTKKLEPGETSEALISSVELLSSAGTKYLGEEWAFETKAEFVGITGYAYRTAWWQNQSLTSGEVRDLVDTALTPLIQN